MSDASVEEKVEQLERTVKEIQKESLVESADLRKTGIYYGARGVRGALIFMGVMLVSHVALKFVNDRDLFSDTLMLGLAGILGASLIVYFAFIFAYTVRAKVTRNGGEFVADKP